MFNRSLKWIVGILRFSKSRKCLQKSTRSNAFVASKKVQNAAPLSTVYLCSKTVTVCLSVYPSCRPLQQRWQLHGWYSAATVSRVMSSDVGSWTQTCCFCRHHGLSVGHKSNAFCPADVRLTWHYAWNGATPASENRHDGRRTRPTVTSHNTTKTRRHWGEVTYWWTLSSCFVILNLFLKYRGKCIAWCTPWVYKFTSESVSERILKIS